MLEIKENIGDDDVPGFLGQIGNKKSVRMRKPRKTAENRIFRNFNYARATFKRGNSYGITIMAPIICLCQLR